MPKPYTAKQYERDWKSRALVQLNIARTALEVASDELECNPYTLDSLVGETYDMALKIAEYITMVEACDA